jgi:hypothetical protein
MGFGISIDFLWHPSILELDMECNNHRTVQQDIRKLIQSILFLEQGKCIGSLSNPRLWERDMLRSYRRKDLCRKRIGYRSRVFLGQDTHICSLRNPIFLDLGKVSIAIQNILLDTHNCM